MVKVRGFKPQGIDNPLLNTGAKPHREIDGELSLAIAKLASKPRLTVEEYQARLRKKEEEENKRIDEWDAKYGEEYRRKLAEDREKVLNPQKSKKKKHHRHRHRHHKKKHGSSSSPSSSSSSSSSPSSSYDESDSKKGSGEKGKGPWKLSAFFQATDDSKKRKEKDKKDKKKRHHHHKHHSKHHHSKHRSHSKKEGSSESGSESSRSGSDKSSSNTGPVPEKKAKLNDESDNSTVVGVSECPDIKTPPTPSSPQQK